MSCNTPTQPDVCRPPRRREFHWLYLAGFANCFSTSAWWTAIPFVVTAMGGTPNHVGCAVGIYTIVYMVGCLVGSVVLSGKDPKRLVMIGLAGSAVALGALAVVVQFSNHLSVTAAIRSVYGIAALFGYCQSLTWSFLFSWQSSGHSGVALGRRMGLYLFAVNCGGLISPFLIGKLLEGHMVIPLWLTATGYLIALGAGRATPAPSTADTAGKNQPGQKPVVLLDPQRQAMADRFLWMTRVLLVASTICTTMFRTQLPLLMKFHLGYTESHFGILVTLFSMVSLPLYLLIARFSQWHYHFGSLMFFWAAMPLATFMISRAGALATLGVISMMQATSHVFMFNSHLFYSGEGSRQRSRRMALHEVLMGLGLSIGSFGGGWLVTRYSLMMPYYVASALSLLAGFIAAAMWLTLSRGIKAATHQAAVDTASVRATGVAVVVTGHAGAVPVQTDSRDGDTPS